MIFEKLQKLIADQFTVDEDTITMNTSFTDDLGADSLELVEFIMAVEECFDMPETDEKVLAGMSTVGDVVKYISNVVE